jgi:uncharacterized protein
MRLQLHREAWRGASESFQKQLNRKNGFWHTEMENAQKSLEDDREIPLLVLDRLGMMILGMALYKIGFFSGKLSTKTYLTLALVELLVSMPMLGIGLWKTWASGIDMITFEVWLFIPNSYYRVMGTLGMSSLLLVIFKSNRLFWFTRSLEAVGQTALSNYLLCSLLADIVFSWGPWKLYGRLEQYQLNYIIAGFWGVNLIWSTIWLKYFEFGPAEWLWRSLTYWQRQPMLSR